MKVSTKYLNCITGVVFLWLTVCSVAFAHPPIDTVEKVIDTFAEEGIDLLDWTFFDEETDPNKMLGRPGQYVEKVIFWDSRTGDPERTDAIGTVEVFKSEKDLGRRMDYVERIGQKMPMLLQYQFKHKKMLLRLDKKLTPTQAKEYEKALKKM